MEVQVLRAFPIVSESRGILSRRHHMSVSNLPTGLSKVLFGELLAFVVSRFVFVRFCTQYQGLPPE